MILENRINSKKLTIILPVYNLEMHISKCIESVLKQTFKKIELLIINDGSTDNSGIICEEYRKIDNRIRVFHQYNKGVSSARNKGLKYASGDYITFIDGDDWIEEDLYEKMIYNLESNAADICIGGLLRNFDSGKEVPFSNIQDKVSMNNLVAIENMLEEKMFAGFIWDKIYKKELFNNIKFNEDIKLCEDVLINFTLFSRAKKIFFIPLNKYHYFSRENSASNEKFSAMKVDSVIVYKRIYTMIENTFPELKKAGMCRLTVSYIISSLESTFFINKSNQKFFYETRKILKKNSLDFLLNEHAKFKYKLAMIYIFLPYRVLGLLNKYLKEIIYK